MAKTISCRGIHIYTDGGLQQSLSEFPEGRGYGGTGIVGIDPVDDAVIFEHCFHHGGDVTNQMMELAAVIDAMVVLNDLKVLEDTSITIFSDSAYLVNCFNQNWWVGWLNKGWLTSAGKPVANKEYWQAILSQTRAVAAASKNRAIRPSRDDMDLVVSPARKFSRPLKFVHVKGHSGNKWNEVADKLATVGKNPKNAPKDGDAREYASFEP